MEVRPLDLHDSVRLIMKTVYNFTARLYSDCLQGIASPYPDYPYPLPTLAEELATAVVIYFKDSPLITSYLTLLDEPDRNIRLIRCFCDAYANDGSHYTDEIFFQWIVLCCLVGAALHLRGFSQAPIIAVETIRLVIIVHERYAALRFVGYGV